MHTVLVANRGEIAVRIIRAVHAAGGRAVAIYPADDADALHVRLADEALVIPGAGPASYLDVEAVVAAAVSARSSAVHPGYGFLSESAAFARRCAEAGITFIGPAPEVLDLFGDKARARRFALACDVPVLPGTSEATALEEALAFAAEHGPVMVKALAGGGGRGLRAVSGLDALPEAFARAASEARQAFGRDELYVEKLLDRPRHIEVQVLGDGAGAVVALGERDCSIQRRHQKLVEVAPSPWLDDDLRTRLMAAAVRLAAGSGYAGLGTIEFLVRGEQFWFMEANPRLQVEHTVTEEVTGVDLVAAQLAVASGSTLAGLGLADTPLPRGVAIQARVNAETLGPDGAPVPSTGQLGWFTLPTGPGVRVDTHGYPGYRVSPRYDPLLAKIIVRGPDLAAAAARAAAALEETVIAGVATNADLLHGIVSSEAFLAGPWDTGFVAGHLRELHAHRRTSRLPGDAPSGDPPSFIQPPDSRAVSVPAGAVVIRAPSPGVVLRLDTEAGGTVGAGGAVMVIEAMKMEHVVRAPAGLRIDVVTAGVGDAVEADTVLAYGTPVGSAEAAVVAGDEDGAAALGDWSAEVAEIERRRGQALRMGGPEKVARQHADGKLDARQRVAALADPGSFAEIGVLAGFARYEATGDGGTGEEPAFTPANFIAGTARIDGRKVVLGVDDFTLRGGSGDAAIHAKQVFAEQYAREMRLPVVRLLDGASGGGSVKMAVDAGYTYVPVNPAWDAIVDNLSLVPVAAAALGPTVGLGAARLVMSHLSVLVEGRGQLFTAGPPVVLGGTGERLTKEELGGADVHRSNGAVERIVPDEETAFAVVRQFLSYLPGSVFELPPVTAAGDPAGRREEGLLGAVPRNPRRPYDVHAVLAAVFDEGSVFRYAGYGGGTLTALARLDGHPVGVIAADPSLGATMSVEGAFAVTRLVDLCETFHLPVVSLTDQAGMTIGSAAERTATIRHGARAITAVYQARVPQAELIVRRVYGVGGAGLINRHRASRSWAWPSGDWGSLPARGGIEAAFRARLEAAADPAAELARLTAQVAAVTSPFRTAEHFGVQDIIDPRESRPLLCDWVRDAYRVLPEQVGRPSFGTRP
jgi:acetyl/propionyl-CoA carboxylase alpha subunit/acetyl-CoA carboxylase carboxyltransferase component